MADTWRRLGRLLLSWTLATTLGGVVAYALVVALAAPIEGIWVSPLALSLPAAGLLSGLFTGLFQRRILDPFWATSPRWVVATAVGWGLGVPIVVVLSALLKPLLAGLPGPYRLSFYLIAAGATGALSSIGQWKLLKEVTAGHLWWLLANGVGWLMAWLVLLAVGLFVGGGESLPAALDRILEAGLLGALAGFTLGFEQAVAITGLFAQQAWEKRTGRPTVYN